VKSLSGTSFETPEVLILREQAGVPVDRDGREKAVPGRDRDTLAGATVHDGCGEQVIRRFREDDAASDFTRFVEGSVPRVRMRR
jgi:hypothetical protein